MLKNMTRLHFFKDEGIFFENGKLKPEPAESLEALMDRYERAKAEHLRMEALAAPWRRTRWVGGTKPAFLEDPVRNYGHRTWQNAAWSDITLALAVDFQSPGEITTKKAAGDKYLCHPLPISRDNMMEEARKIAEMIHRHPKCKAEGIRLNIAGNGAVTLAKKGVYTGYVADLLSFVYRFSELRGIKILEVRSGGQSGVDEAGILAAQRRGIRCSILAPKGFRWRDEAGNEREGQEGFISRFRETVTDFDAWKKADEASFDTYIGSNFSGNNALEYLEYEIDLKTLHQHTRDITDGK